MTTTATPGVEPMTGPSIHVVRARKLLYAGLAGGLAAAVLSLIGFGIGYGTHGLITAAIAAAMVLFFYSVGQLVMVLFADAGARTLLTVSLLSYTTRVLVLGLILLSYSHNRDAWPTLVPMAMFLTTVAVVVGWLVVEVICYQRLRIGIYDTPYTPEKTVGDAPDGTPEDERVQGGEGE